MNKKSENGHGNGAFRARMLPGSEQVRCQGHQRDADRGNVADKEAEGRVHLNLTLNHLPSESSNSESLIMYA